MVKKKPRRKSLWSLSHLALTVVRKKPVRGCPVQWMETTPLKSRDRQPRRAMDSREQTLLCQTGSTANLMRPVYVPRHSQKGITVAQERGCGWAPRNWGRRGGSLCLCGWQDVRLVFTSSLLFSCLCFLSMWPGCLLGSSKESFALEPECVYVCIRGVIIRVKDILTAQQQRPAPRVPISVSKLQFAR